MKLVNLYSYGRDISLFCRDNEGILHIDRDTNYFPYYYKVSPTGKYKSLTGVSLEKIFISNPKEMWDVSLLPDVYEADIYFTKKYMIDKIDKIDKSIIKYCFIDIEVLANELPDEEQVLYPISCVSLYNSLTKTIQSWYIGEYSGTLEEKEQKLLDAFINYMAKERFDLW